MFDFIKRMVGPGESDEDSHHLGVQVWNPSEHEAVIRLDVGGTQLDMTLPPNGFVTGSDEQSRYRVVVMNMSQETLSVEWKKSRD